MELEYLKALPTGGFNFDNCIRNRALAESGMIQQPKQMKTGTTICGVIYKVSPCLYLPFLPPWHLLTLLSRTEWSWPQTPEPQAGLSWVTRTARRSTILLQTSSVAALARPPTATTSQVINQILIRGRDDQAPAGTPQT